MCVRFVTCLVWCERRNFSVFTPSSLRLLRGRGGGEARDGQAEGEDRVAGWQICCCGLRCEKEYSCSNRRGRGALAVTRASCGADPRPISRAVAATECSIGAGKPAVKATAGRYVVRIIVVILALMTYRVCGVMHITVMTGETDVTDGKAVELVHVALVGTWTDWRVARRSACAYDYGRSASAVCASSGDWRGRAALTVAHPARSYRANRFS